MDCKNQPCLDHGCCMVGEASSAEAGEDTEGEVEGADDDAGREAHRPGWDTEVGDHPEGVKGERWNDTSDERFEFELREAVEKEVGGDQVILSVGSKGESVGVLSLEANCRVEGAGPATLAKQMDHGGAGVDGVGVDTGIGGHQGSEETAISIAEDERPLLMEQAREKVQAAAFESTAEGEVFEPTIRTGDEIEVGVTLHWRRKGMRRTGVSRTRSAAARSVRAEMFRRRA